ncbi:MAG: hypothetical protein EP343_28110 [Deltaproteobacteria bacterium]|nr:MAG: hypothetical protein EP343_28110 [Deltaproteobacteria bacterium]
MDTSLQQFLKIYQFTSGRRLLVYRQTKKVAQKLNFTALEQHIDKAHAFELDTRKMERRWKSQGSTSQQTIDYRPLDNALDRALSGLSKYCESYLHSMDETSDHYQSALVILETAFPNGLQAITQIPYEDELSDVESLLDDLNNVTLATHINRLGLKPMLDNIKSRHQAFYKAFSASQAPTLDYGTVRARRAQSQDMLLQMIAIILGKFYDSDSHAEPRKELLTPFQLQQGRISDLISRKRPVLDVDPESGEELPDSEEAEETPETNETQAPT